MKLIEKLIGTLLDNLDIGIPNKKVYSKMKYIISIVKPSKLESVPSALIDAGIHGLTTSEVSGFGRQKGHTEIYRGAQNDIGFIHKIKIDVAMTDAQEASVIEAITEIARTEKIGDGKIFVLNLDQAARIQPGETSNQAL